jgi:hypothetical protein
MDIPNGYMQNARGHLVPSETIDEISILRDGLVREMVVAAEQLQTSIKIFKARMQGDFQAFLELSAEKYGVVYGGAKGNVTLTAYDGSLQVVLAMADHISFDERLQVAKEMVDQCIHRLGEGVNPLYRALAMNAFQVDKKGSINTQRVLEMTRWNIDDEEWNRAMKAIRDSVFVSGSKSYMRFYRRKNPAAKFEQVSLDFSAL